MGEVNAPTIADFRHVLVNINKYGVDKFMDEMSGVSSYTSELKRQVLHLLRDAGFLEWFPDAETPNDFPARARVTLSGIETARILDNPVSRNLHTAMSQQNPPLEDWMPIGLFLEISTKHVNEAALARVADIRT